MLCCQSEKQVMQQSFSLLSIHASKVARIRLGNFKEYGFRCPFHTSGQRAMDKLLDLDFNDFHKQATEFIKDDEVRSLQLAVRFYTSAVNVKVNQLERDREATEKHLETLKNAAESVIASKDEVILQLKASVAETKKELISTEARTQAILGNRMVLEIALHYYGVAVNLAKSSYTKQYEHLRDSRLLCDNNKMREPCKTWLTGVKRPGHLFKRNVCCE